MSDDPKEGRVETPKPSRETDASPKEGLIGPETDAFPVNKKAWENPGTFQVEAREGKSYAIEGWLAYRESKRSPEDQKLQGETTKTLKEKPGYENADGGHLIAHSLGGPTVKEHGQETARANLVAMESRGNRSFVEGFEKEIKNELKKNPEQRLYMRVEVRYRDNGDPQDVTHRVYKEGADGKPEPFRIASVTTRIDPSEEARISQTAGEAAANVGERRKDSYKEYEGKKQVH